MDRIEFYRTINDKIIKDKTKDKLIFYDFRENYFDIKKSKIRIGIKKADHKKFKTLKKKINKKFDIVDMRMSLVYGFQDEDDRKELFKFINDMTKESALIYLFINNENELKKNSKNTDIINKGDQVWIPKLDNNKNIKEILVKDEEGSETQYCYDFKKFKNELKHYQLEVKEEHSLDELSKKMEVKYNFIGEYILVLRKIM